MKGAINMQNACIVIKPVISFCIPTYNRSEKIYNLVLEILKHNGDDIEVVVLDNHSTDNTKATLSTIKDSRFVFYENESNLGGNYNFVKAMTKGKGDFIIFCTDKDYMDHHNIVRLVGLLKNNTEIAVGYCKLNTNEENEFEIFDRGMEALKNMAYLSKHPTGYFYKNEYLSLIDILENFSDTNKVGAFPFEFICAEVCLLGKAVIVNMPLCTTETREQAREYKSLTYSPKNKNIYFFPKKRYDLLENYVMHIASLSISKKNKWYMVKKVLNQELFSATIGFKRICNDLYICEHYNMQTREVGFIELFKDDFGFCSKFINRCSYGSKARKLFLCLQVQFTFLAKVMKMLIIKLIKKIKNWKG